jgi:hypothetical protein
MKWSLLGGMLVLGLSVGDGRADEPKGPSWSTDYAAAKAAARASGKPLFVVFR